MLPFKLTLGAAQPVDHPQRHVNDTAAEILIDFREDEGASLGFLSCFCDTISGEPKQWRVVGVDGGDIPDMTCFYNTQQDAMDAAHTFVNNLIG